MHQPDNNFSTLWKLMAGNRGRYFMAMIAMFCGVGLLYVTPLITRAAIDGIIDSHPSAHLAAPAKFLTAQVQRWGVGLTLGFVALAVMAVTASAAFCQSLQGRFSGIASEAIARQLRDRLFAHLQHVPMAWHDKAQTGDTVQRCTSDVDTVRLFYREQVIEIARTSSRILIGFPILLWLDWKMALLATALMPVIVSFAVLFFRRVQGSFKKTDEAEGLMTTALQENLTGIRVVRAFARQEFEIERFSKKNAEYRDRNRHLFTLMAVYWSTSDLMCLIQFASIVFFGAYRASKGTITIGTMIAFVSYAQMFIWPIREVGRVLTELGKPRNPSPPAETHGPTLATSKAMSPANGPTGIGKPTRLKISPSGRSGLKMARSCKSRHHSPLISRKMCGTSPSSVTKAVPVGTPPPSSPIAPVP